MGKEREEGVDCGVATWTARRKQQVDAAAVP